MKITDIKVGIDEKLEEKVKLLIGSGDFVITKKSLDARNKNNIFYNYSIEYGDIAIKPTEYQKIKKEPTDPIMIVGSGPCGLFCAIRLIKHGFHPIIIERGESVDDRQKSIDAFVKTQTLNTESNIQFGEGGAGTFSDGKLNTQTHSVYNSEVLETFVEFGAPKEIIYLSKPHIGSDNLKTVIKNMRQYVINNGGQVLFKTKLKNINLANGRVVSAVIESGSQEKTVDVSALVLAIGHSARDTFEMLDSKSVYMEQKNFAVGVRIEHLQSDVGFSQYGKAYEKLPPADYKLVSHVCEKSAFTFCMCPGGFVMPATSEEGGVVVNGMSNYLRNGTNSNSALIVQVDGSDYGERLFDGVNFQRKIERNAYNVSGSYSAPIQLVGDFLKNKKSTALGKVIPTYPISPVFAKMDEILPEKITETMRASIVDMDKRLKGFASFDSVLTAVESRTSSPIRIVRDETMQSVSVKKLYPCGEGAGYAGGITSSAADGIKVAERIFDIYK